MYYNISIVDFIKKGFDYIMFKYMIKAMFEDSSECYGYIGFDISFPMQYNSKDEAERNSANIAAVMNKNEDNTVDIWLYENNNKVDVIKWDEWYKYKCYKIKDSSKAKIKVDALSDYEPCDMKFEDIFAAYYNTENKSRYNISYIAYKIQAIETDKKKE